MFICGLIIGLVVGAGTGFFVAALLHVSERGNDKKYEDD